MDERLRIQFEFPPQAVEDLDAAKDKLGFASRVDVIRQAVGLLLAILRKRDEGWKLAFVRGNEELEVELPTPPPSGEGGTVDVDIGSL